MFPFGLHEMELGFLCVFVGVHHGESPKRWCDLTVGGPPLTVFLCTEKVAIVRGDAVCALPGNARRATHGLRRRIATGKWSIRATGAQTKDDRHNPVRDHVSVCNHVSPLRLCKKERFFISTFWESSYIVWNMYVRIFFFQSQAAGLFCSRNELSNTERTCVGYMRTHAVCVFLFFFSFFWVCW